MDQIITSLSQRTHLPETVVRSGIGVILNFIKKEAAGSQFEKFVAILPGADSLMAESANADAAPAAPASGGLFGSLMQEAGQLLGGQFGDATQAIGALQKAGVPLEKAGPLATGFIEHAEGIVGGPQIAALLEQVPALKSLLGGAS